MTMPRACRTSAYLRRRCAHISCSPGAVSQARLLENQECADTERYVFGKLSARCFQHLPVFFTAIIPTLETSTVENRRRGVCNTRHRIRYTAFWNFGRTSLPQPTSRPVSCGRWYKLSTLLPSQIPSSGVCYTRYSCVQYSCIHVP